MAVESKDAREEYSRLDLDGGDVEAGSYQQSSATNIPTDSSAPVSSGPSSNTDGTSVYILAALLTWQFFWGNLANLEPLLPSCQSATENVTVECISGSGWLPDSFLFSVYFIFAIGILTIFSRSLMPPLLLLVVTILSILQEWIYLGAYYPAANTFANNQTPGTRSLLHFSQGAALLYHLSKYVMVFVVLVIFRRRGGDFNLSGLRNRYQNMTSGNFKPMY